MKIVTLTLIIRQKNLRLHDKNIVLTYFLVVIFCIVTAIMVFVILLALKPDSKKNKKILIIFRNIFALKVY